MATEKRLIDANALKAEFPVIGQFEKDLWHSATIQVAIDNAQTVEAAPVVHGRWEPRTDVFGFVRCSACHDCNIYDDWADGKKWSYCPNCGAKMDGDGNG